MVLNVLIVLIILDALNAILVIIFQEGFVILVLLDVLLV